MFRGEIVVLLLGLATLTARLGACFYFSGMSRAKNAAAAVIRSAADLCVVVLAFWAVGYAIMGARVHAVFGLDGSFASPDAFFLTASILIATAAALGGSLERCRFFVPLAGSAALAGLVIPLAARWVWTGWLYKLDFIDDAGASFIHLAGGAFALAAAIVAGPRGGKYNRDGSVNLIPGHSFTQAAAGALLIAAALVPQFLGCILARQVSDGAAAAVFANGILAAAAGGLAGLVLGRARDLVADAHFILIGMIAGVISISAAPGRLPSLAVVVIAAIGGLLAPLFSVWLDVRRRIDDPGCCVSMHGVAGVWSLIAAGFFAESGNRAVRVLIQVAGAAAIGALALAAALAVLLALRFVANTRLTEADELDGSDLVEHDLNAYPDFQQTMIKSYHMRQT